MSEDSILKKIRTLTLDDEKPLEQVLSTISKEVDTALGDQRMKIQRHNNICTYLLSRGIEKGYLIDDRGVAQGYVTIHPTRIGYIPASFWYVLYDSIAWFLVSTTGITLLLPTEENLVPDKETQMYISKEMLFISQSPSFRYRAIIPRNTLLSHDLTRVSIKGTKIILPSLDHASTDVETWMFT